VYNRLIREVHNVNVSVVRSYVGVLTVIVKLIVKSDVHRTIFWFPKFGNWKSFGYGSETVNFVLTGVVQVHQVPQKKIRTECVFFIQTDIYNKTCYYGKMWKLWKRT
jgi:hypothetical protein